MDVGPASAITINHDLANPLCPVYVAFTHRRHLLRIVKRITETGGGLQQLHGRAEVIMLD